MNTNNLDINKLKNIKWKYIHKRKRTPFYNYILWDGVSHHYNKEIEFSYEMKNLLALDGDLMFEESEYMDSQNKVVEILKSNNNYFIEIVNSAYGLDSEIVSFLKGVETKTLKGELSKEDKKVFFKKYFDLSLKASSFMLFPMFLENYLETSIKNKLIEKYGSQKAEEIMHELSTPTKLTSTLEEEISILNIAKKENFTKGDLEDLVYDFAWLKNSLMDANYYSEDDYKKRLDEIIKNNNAETKFNEIIENQDKHKKIVEKYKEELGKDFSILIDTLLEAIYFRSWRTERMYRNISLIKNYIFSISNDIGLTNNDIFYLTPNEVIESLETLSFDKKIIEERKNGFIIYANGIDTLVCSGDIVIEAKNKIDFLDIKDVKEIKGQTAYPGKISGKVMLILTKNDFNKAKPDNILVTHSTTPDFIPIMKMSLAFITDEGGILSHASVLSRELKKPCIIGTKNATGILKDGDMIEVDADNGVVRIIK